MKYKSSWRDTIFLQVTLRKQVYFPVNLESLIHLDFVGPIMAAFSSDSNCWTILNTFQLLLSSLQTKSCVFNFEFPQDYSAFSLSFQAGPNSFYVTSSSCVRLIRRLDLPNVEALDDAERDDEKWTDGSITFQSQWRHVRLCGLCCRSTLPF